MPSTCGNCPLVHDHPDLRGRVPLCARSNGKSREIAVTHRQADTRTTCVNPAQRICTGSFPNWWWRSAPCRQPPPTSAAWMVLYPRGAPRVETEKEEDHPPTRNVAGVSHNDHVACGTNAVATSIATPIAAIIPPTTDTHRDGGHGQQPRQPGEMKPSGRVLSQGESGAAAASEGS
jgi:hypothetical protein